MKKVIVVLALMLSASIVVTSCKGEKKEHNDESEMHEDHAADKADLAMNMVYQCPMDCEEGKTYKEEGNCPVCKMALKKVEGEHNDNDESHEGDSDGEHKEGENHDGDEGHEEDKDGDS
jgi:hypothetical protein